MNLEIDPTLRKFVDDSVAAGKFGSPSEVVNAALRVLRRETTAEIPAEPRQGGQWKGRVRLAPDFDEVPDELREAFGISST